MFSNSKTQLAFLFCAVLFSSCSNKTVSQSEEQYMSSRYAEKAERPSPPANTISKIGNAEVSLNYSQPSVRGREIWDELVPYDKIWRTGANEATIFKTTSTVIIEGDTVLSGKYSVFTVPSENSWTVMINKKFDVWGAYDYDEKFDAARFDVVPVIVPEFEEKMIFTIDSTGLVEFAWENLRFNFQVKTL